MCDVSQTSKMIASYNGKKVKYCMTIFGEGLKMGGGLSPRALSLGFITWSWQGWQLFCTTSQKWVEMTYFRYRFTVYQTWCRCYQSSGNYDWIIFESEKIERLIKIKKNRDKKKWSQKFPRFLALWISFKVIKLICS